MKTLIGRRFFFKAPLWGTKADKTVSTLNDKELLEYVMNEERREGIRLMTEVYKFFLIKTFCLEP